MLGESVVSNLVFSFAYLLQPLVSVFCAIILSTTGLQFWLSNYGFCVSRVLFNCTFLSFSVSSVPVLLFLCLVVFCSCAPLSVLRAFPNIFVDWGFFVFFVSDQMEPKLSYSYLLGLLAMIKCSICSYQCDN